MKIEDLKCARQRKEDDARSKKSADIEMQLPDLFHSMYVTPCCGILQERLQIVVILFDSALQLS
jgi:hypothetical protein